MLKELFNQDLWELYDKGNWIAITTNNVVKNNGEVVMGRGVALEAARRLPSLPKELGNLLRSSNLNNPCCFSNYRLVTFPTKYHYRNDSDILLIQHSAEFLSNWFSNKPQIEAIYIPRPGCGNGNLNWEDVKLVIEPILDDRFTVVSL